MCVCLAYFYHTLFLWEFVNITYYQTNEAHLGHSSLGFVLFRSFALFLIQLVYFHLELL